MDAAANVYVADSDHEAIKEISASGGYSTAATLATVPLGDGVPTGVAVDRSGNVFYISTDGGSPATVQELALATPPSLQFASTAYGATSASQTVAVSNAGTTALNATSLSIASGFLQQSSGGTDCSASSSVAVGGSCNLQLAFQPAAVGSASGSAVLTDNNLNAAGTLQTMDLTGTGTAASLTVTASNGAMTYGGAVPAITPAYSGFVYSDTATSAIGTAPVCTTTATGASAAGSAQTSSCSGGSAANYGFTFVPGTVTVGKAPLTVAASSPSMTYGGAVPTITADFSGFVNSQTSAVLTAQPICATTATSASAAGSAQTSSCTGGSAVNYSFTFVPGTVTVGKASLTVTASSPSMTYGGAVPTITPGYSGFVNGDTATTAIATAPNCTTTAASSSAAGSVQTSSCSGGSAANYSFTFVPGAVTVNKAPLAVSAAAVSVPFGSAIPALTPSYSGFVNGDTSASLSGSPSLATAATSSSNVGSYPITVGAGTLAAANYSFNFTNGAVTITPASQTITFNPIANQTLGAAPLTLSASASSNLPVAFTLVSGPATLSDAVLTLTGGGTVVVSAGQAGNANYQAAAAVQQSFTVTAPGLSVSPSSLSFGNDLVSASTAAQSVTVGNTGAAAMAISGISVTGDYSQDNNCPASLAAGASCTVSVVFTASATGARSGLLTVATALAGTQTVALSGTGTSFVFSATGGASATIDAGQTQVFTASLTPGTFTGTVALGCAAVPATVACTISPASAALTAGGAATTVTATVATTTRSLIPPVGGGDHSDRWRWLLLLLAPLLLLLPRRRRLIGVLAWSALAAAGCANNVSNLPNANGGTPAGQYQINATATVGKATQSVTFNLTVE